MAVGLWNLEFLNLNQQRRYPLADDASGVDATGTFRLPTDFLVALDIPISAGLSVDPAKFYVRNVGAFSTGVSIVVAYDGADGPVNVATASVLVTTHTENQAYALGGIAPFDDTVGKVCVGNLENLLKQPPGFYEFEFEQGRLDPMAARPQLRGVSAIVVVNGSQRSAPIYGDVELVAGSNFRVTQATVGDTTQVRLDAIQGQGLTENCACQDTLGSPIYTINDIRPTTDGRFYLAPGTCVEFEEISNGLKVSNPCSQPCLPCTSLEQLTQILEQLGAQAGSVKDFVQQLAVRANAFDVHILGARLRDEGCVTC